MDWEDAGLPLEGALADRASRPASCVGAQTVLSRGVWPPYLATLRGAWHVSCTKEPGIDS
jgi:hypothetical protein